MYKLLGINHINYTATKTLCICTSEPDVAYGPRDQKVGSKHVDLGKYQ